MRIFLFVLLTATISSSGVSRAENLSTPSSTSALVRDIKASVVGDTLTVIIVQSAEARNSSRNARDRSSTASGSVSAGDLSEFFDLSLGRDYSGVGEVRRSESFVTQMSATVTGVMPNGDLLIEGGQSLQINGETTRIDVTGRVRPYDITGQNTILSSRIADARIQYDGKGFVSDSARPGLISRIFETLGLF